jgi:hypothetical protein
MPNASTPFQVATVAHDVENADIRAPRGDVIAEPVRLRLVVDDHPAGTHEHRQEPEQEHGGRVAARAAQRRDAEQRRRSPRPTPIAAQ